MSARTTQSGKHRTFKLRIEDDDVTAILAAMGDAGRIDPARQANLLNFINYQLAEAASLSESLKRRRAPHEELRRWKHLQRSLNDSLAALSDVVILMDLAQEASREAGDLVVWDPVDAPFVQELRRRRPERIDSMMTSLHKMAVTHPSDSAKEQVTELMRGIGRLLSLAQRAEATARDRQHQLGGKEVPHHRDPTRQNFCMSLVPIYLVIFRLWPRKTRGGPWCSFLAAALHRCGGPRLGEDAAYKLSREILQTRGKTDFDRLFTAMGLERLNM